MGLIERMKNAVRGTSEWLRTDPTAEDDEHDYSRWYQRTTTASRRAEAQARERMVHVSKPITDEMRMAVDWGLPGVAAEIMRRTKGVTYDSPVSHVKRRADVLANEMGLSNKLRRRLRSGMVRRLEELNTP